ncbi:MAG: DUF1732 domain-containing protein [Bacteroidetes bacterium]|nr:DUF1732 domain-containing protein [Bacteroidota bacterium]MBK7639338.1 DUF1732 domain-containing protein [Bacteroidota bacterium]MBK8674518.1 DUF1732 domain-containing protein [Bacteroidota bacterium]MBK9635691.1 DUF1732 domain-containing protein [Bacteroidota bacterium]MBL0289078.1 DUF1732 domain-containing protein [Bacteroidota bacterium]
MYSMTGYGKQEFQINSQNYQCEIKSLNSKGLEINFKTPSFLKSREIEIRNILGTQLERGKIDIVFSLQETQKKSLINDTEKFKMQFDFLKQFAIENGVSSDTILPALLMLQERETVSEKEELSDTEWEAYKMRLLDTIEQVWQFRKREGVVVFDFLMERVQIISAKLVDVKAVEKDRFVRQKDKLAQMISSNFGKVNFNPDRLEQEMLFYIEKMDISEEISRLAAHLHYFNELLEGTTEKSVGKKIGFVAQEMGREINTLGAKANDANLQRLVVDMKDELEKIKEQIANVL